jgi:prepilin-type N-terminal cleavage/methylation domain-containing protein
MKSEKGFTLIEVIIAVALLGVIAIAILSALSTASLAVFTADDRATAESLARSEMEYVKKQPYEYGINPSYEKADNASANYPDYTVSIYAEPLHGTDDGVQKITIIIKHLGKPVITSGNSTLEDYKVDR